MDYNQILDKSLLYLDNDNLIPESFTHIHKNIGFEITEKNLELVLLKLERDGYVYKKARIRNIPDLSRTHLWSYSITFDGRAFWDKGKGGYVNQKINNDTEDYRLRLRD